MKLIKFQFLETRSIVVPDECPTTDVIDMERYIRKNIDSGWEGTEDTRHTIVKDADSNGWEIVSVEENYKEEE